MEKKARYEQKIRKKQLYIFKNVIENKQKKKKIKEKLT
jgi:hypothetical protein